MNELILGYPAYVSWGIFETYFQENTGSVIKFLEEDNIIKTFPPKKMGDPILYRVTSDGIIFANAMAQLEYSQKMNKFTKIIILLGVGTFIFAVEQIFITLFG
ncbi:hypothetical protein HY212_05470 [Candidatus Pacearchaeota archaeon]|nr:hypothetical protein [Candidatus Pacearchaeota archaeon]